MSAQAGMGTRHVGKGKKSIKGELSMGNKLYVGNLSYNTTEEGIRQLFGQVGEVKSVRIIMDRFSGRSKGFGFVEMADDATAQTAVEKLNGAELDGRSIRVSQAREREERPRHPRGRGRP